MKIDIVTYDQALKLKEKNFDWPCHYWYNYREELIFDKDALPANQNSFQQIPAHADAPTFNDVRDWAREVHNYDIQIFWEPCLECWGYNIVAIAAPEYHIVDKIIDVSFAKYTEAFSKAIDKFLEIT